MEIQGAEAGRDAVKKELKDRAFAYRALSMNSLHLHILELKQPRDLQLTALLQF